MSEKFWNTESFDIEGALVEFRFNTPHPQDDEETAAAKLAKMDLGELIPLVTIIPANPSGEVNKIWYPEVVDQHIREALEAATLSIIAKLVGDPKVQLYDVRDAGARRYGRMGWAHFSAFNFNNAVTQITYPKVNANGKVVKDLALVSLPREWDKAHSIWRVSKNIPSEWLRLQKDTENTWRAVADNTVDQRTGLGNGSLLAGYRLQLHTGVTFRIAPSCWQFTAKSGEKKGEVLTMTKMQEKAQKFYALVKSIASGEQTIEEAGRQYFQDKLFDRISYAQAQGEEIPDEVHTKIVEALNPAEDAEEEAATGVMVTFEGEKVDMNSLPKGNYIFRKDDGTVTFHNNRTYTGMKNMANLVERLNGRVVLERATWETK